MPATLIYTSATQVAAVVPDSVSGGHGAGHADLSGPALRFVSGSGCSHRAGDLHRGCDGAGARRHDQSKGLRQHPRPLGGDLMTLFLTGVGHATPAIAI